MSLCVETTSAFLQSNDARDKFTKGVGCLFKLLGAINANPNFMKFSASMSDARCIMRMASWIGNVKKISDAFEKRTIAARDVIYILRVLCDGLFSLLDNVSYSWKFFDKANPAIAQISWNARASLFYGYVFAVMLDVYDLATDANIPNVVDKYLLLTRNACDMVSCGGNVSSALDCGVKINSALGLTSAIIACRELAIVAHKKAASKK